MPSELARLRRSQHLLLRLLEELERTPSRQRTRSMRLLEQRLAEDLPTLERYMPFAHDRAYVTYNSKVYSALRVSVHPGRLPLPVRRIAVFRSMKLVSEALMLFSNEQGFIMLPAPKRSWSLDELKKGLSWFADKHPVLLTAIILLLIVALAWRQDFTFSTKLGGAEIRIQGEQRMLPVAPAPVAPELVEYYLPTAAAGAATPK